MKVMVICSFKTKTSSHKHRTSVPEKIAFLVSKLLNSSRSIRRYATFYCPDIVI